MYLSCTLKSCTQIIATKWTANPNCQYQWSEEKKKKIATATKKDDLFLICLILTNVLFSAPFCWCCHMDFVLFSWFFTHFWMRWPFATQEMVLWNVRHLLLKLMVVRGMRDEGMGKMVEGEWEVQLLVMESISYRDDRYSTGNIVNGIIVLCDGRW